MSSDIGLKYDQGKQDWYATPLEVIELLAAVFEAGEKKYETFNCLKPFENSNRRFYNGALRHLKDCQLDPLAIDKDTGCYHAAQVAFNTLMRLYHAKRQKESEKESDTEPIE